MRRWIWTAITDEEGVYGVLFIYDLFGAWSSWIRLPDKRFATGVGVQDFKICWKIVFPDLKVTIADSLNKRITFWIHSGDAELKRRAVSPWPRWNFWAKQELRRIAGVVRLLVLLPNLWLSDASCMPLVKRGYFLALKAAHTEVGVEASESNAILGGRRCLFHPIWRFKPAVAVTIF